MGAISNIVLDFTPHKKIFLKCGCVIQLIQLVFAKDGGIVNSVLSLLEITSRIEIVSHREPFMSKETSMNDPYAKEDWIGSHIGGLQPSPKAEEPFNTEYPMLMSHPWQQS